ncbi:LytTR family DNA-binding domain-containing protein [Mucilaginibacter daejeonensis]|uniref:LytR/AlgR family response regulator transcription factor n=1 Tax=Mucilaginibacter daejeonensis TaxID=398049 RepID=UPI001D16FF87|nr:LytTR family DNA-binding domain-containing protein [Mucilaginibacter daejeonensis]UEG51368.1 LytTR family DNA-binding domain-containing protein [Mucilaginibacter daejeonensis]
MIRCLAVDDQSYATKIIMDHIAKVPFLEAAGHTTNAIEALSRVQQGDIDLVFLDIQMPDLTGIQFLKLCTGKCKVILTTAYPEYALEGFEQDVVDYLLKPIPFERFLKAAHKAQFLINAAKAKGSDNTMSSIPGPTQQGYCFVKSDSKSKFIRIDHNDILYLEGMRNYVSLMTHDRRIMIYRTLRDFESELPQPPFYRIHRSYIISLDKVRLVNGNTVYIGDQTIPIGETYLTSFLNIIQPKL